MHVLKLFLWANASLASVKQGFSTVQIKQENLHISSGSITKIKSERINVKEPMC